MPQHTTTERRARTVAQQLRSLLAREGYRPELEEGEGAPATLRFKAEGVVHLVRFDEGDPGFVQLCTGFALDGATQDELTLLRAAAEVGATTKVVKVALSRKLDVVELQVELFLDRRPLSAALLERSLGALRYATARFFERVRPEVPLAQA